MRIPSRLYLILLVMAYSPLQAQQLTTNNQPARLNIRAAGERSIRITLKPESYKADFPVTPALVDRQYAAPAISITSLSAPIAKRIGQYNVQVNPDPLTITVTDAKDFLVQQVTFGDSGKLFFKIGDAPILGMGEGGPRPERGSNWRSLPVEYDRRGRYHNMQPRWQADAYGSRNPVPLLIGTDGWAIFVAAPWVQVDLREKDKGAFIPKYLSGDQARQQTQTDQQQNLGKGVPPASETVEGLIDLFIFDARNPAALMKEIATISGEAVMPPKWAMGYMQSHRTLEDDAQMLGIIDSFRIKKIPVDAVIYLGTGFTPQGWNTKQPSFDFNPAVFKRDAVSVLSEMHKRQVKVVMHMVPWDRDKLPTLHGNIPAKPNETLDGSHIKNYWQQHVALTRSGVDAFWPDEGDWFNLFERIKRHQLYYQGPISTLPNVRPWSLHRNGFLGIAQWGGWVWSGDTESSWKTLEAQIAVGINHSLSLSPYWGSDIGGFYSNEELTGELYARWYQFASFCPSFRSHGRTWWTRLPWGWGLKELGPLEQNRYPRQSELNNPAIEPVAKKYAELRYQLMPYTYTLAWEARNTGMPLMRSLWLHYTNDKKSAAVGDEFLWGRDLLIAPIYKAGATSRDIYLPPGEWYDWWTNEKSSGGNTITKPVDLSVMPIYVRAGAIIPFDAVRQYTDEKISEPTTIRIYRGANGQFNLYEDDGISLDYLKGKYTLTNFSWDDNKKVLKIKPGAGAGPVKKTYRVMLLPGNTTKNVDYSGKEVSVKF
jgi:alpha-glucosidase (family GH31 glycosyl hydrolase)